MMESHKLNCLIIDENAKNTAVLQRVLEVLPEVGRIYTAVQPYMIKSMLSANTIDIVFIRVRLWDYNQFLPLKKCPTIVFLDGGREKLTNKIETGVSYAMRTPYYAMDASLLIKRIVRERLHETPAFLFLRYEGRFHKTCFGDIEMIERKQGSYVQVFLKQGSWMMPGPITTWVKRLPSGMFVRVSDTLILPVSEANKILGNSYTYKGKEIELTYRFANYAKREMEGIGQWN